MRIVAPAYPSGGFPAGPEDNKSWVSQVLKAGVYSYLDVYSPHLYPAKPYGKNYLETPATNLKEMLDRKIAHLRSTYGTKPIWDTESGNWGVPQAPWLGGMHDRLRVDESERTKFVRQHAERLVRWSLIKKAAGVQRTFYHTFGAGHRSLGAEYGNDLTETTLDPKPAASAMAQMARRLDGADFVKSVSLGTATFAYLFDAKGTPTVVYWNYETPEGGVIQLPLSAADIEVEDLMGNAVTPEVKAGKLVLALGTEPFYVFGRKVAGDALLAAFSKAELRGVAIGQFQVTLSHDHGRPAVAVAFKNMQNSPVDISAKVIGMPDKWRVTQETVEFKGVPAAAEQVRYAPVEDCTGEPAGEPIVTSSLVGDRVLEARRAVRLARAPKRQVAVAVDGNITEAEYGRAVPVMLGKAEQAADTSGPWKGRDSSSARARMVWDDEAIYVAVEVTDDKVVNTAEEGRLFQGDCVEVYLDTATDEDMFAHSYRSHQGKFFCAPAASPGEPGRLDFRPKPAGIDRTDTTKAAMASKRTQTGYTIELKIPVKDMKLSAGVVWGLDLSLIDFDEGNPEWGRNRSQLVWSGHEPWTNPHEFGFILFAP